MSISPRVRELLEEISDRCGSREAFKEMLYELNSGANRWKMKEQWGLEMFQFRFLDHQHEAVYCFVHERENPVRIIHLSEGSRDAA